MEGWSHLQTVNYEKIPFKCKVYHEHGHFAKSCQKKVQLEEGEIPREEWNEVSWRKGNKASTSQANSPTKKKKVPKNRFQALASEVPEPAEVTIVEKEDIQQENKEDEPVLKEIGQEASYEPTLPSQPYVEIRSESSQNSGGSITRSRAKAQMEDISESKEEEAEPLIKNGRKPNEFLRE